MKYLITVDCFCRAIVRKDFHSPSEKVLIASIFRCLERYANVTSVDPSLIIKCTVIKLLNTTVHVESLSLFCNARKTSATPASPEWVAIRICSIYLCDKNSQLDSWASSVGVAAFILGFWRRGLDIANVSRLYLEQWRARLRKCDKSLRLPLSL